MKPKTIRYRSYKNFNNYAFRSTLLNKLMWGESNWKLKNLVNSTLSYINERIPLKSHYPRGSQVPDMNKTISKATMVRSTLKNKYLKNMA